MSEVQALTSIGDLTAHIYNLFTSLTGMADEHGYIDAPPAHFPSGSVIVKGVLEGRRAKPEALIP